MPHPLEHYIIVKIQTSSSSSPMKAIEGGLNDLIEEMSLLEERFKNELSKRRNPDRDQYI